MSKTATDNSKIQLPWLQPVYAIDWCDTHTDIDDPPAEAGRVFAVRKVYSNTQTPNIGLNTDWALVWGNIFTDSCLNVLSALHEVQSQCSDAVWAMVRLKLVEPQKKSLLLFAAPILLHCSSAKFGQAQRVSRAQVIRGRRGWTVGKVKVTRTYCFPAVYRQPTGAELQHSHCEKRLWLTLFQNLKAAASASAHDGHSRSDQWEAVMCYKASGLLEFKIRSKKYTSNYYWIFIKIIWKDFVNAYIFQACVFAGLWFGAFQRSTWANVCRCIINGRLARDFIFTFSFPDSRLEASWHIAASYKSDLEWPLGLWVSEEVAYWGIWVQSWASQSFFGLCWMNVACCCVIHHNKSNYLDASCSCPCHLGPSSSQHPPTASELLCFLCDLSETYQKSPYI